MKPGSVARKLTKNETIGSKINQESGDGASTASYTKFFMHAWSLIITAGLNEAVISLFIIWGEIFRRLISIDTVYSVSIEKFDKSS